METHKVEVPTYDMSNYRPMTKAEFDAHLERKADFLLRVIERGKMKPFVKVQIEPGGQSEFPLDLIAPGSGQHSIALFANKNGTVGVEMGKDYVTIPMFVCTEDKIAQYKAKLLDTATKLGVDISSDDNLIHCVRNNAAGLAVLGSLSK